VFPVRYEIIRIVFRRKFAFKRLGHDIKPDLLSAICILSTLHRPAYTSGYAYKPMEDEAENVLQNEP
jgi:hypothetical protein